MIILLDWVGIFIDCSNPTCCKFADCAHDGAKLCAKSLQLDLERFNGIQPAISTASQGIARALPEGRVGNDVWGNHQVHLPLILTIL